MRDRRIGAVLVVAYVATVFAANWLVAHFGVVPVGFGLKAPAAVYAVGVAFTLRDLVQDRLGVWWVLGAISVGAVLSALVSPAIALASGAAFLFSELADLAVYTPLRRRYWIGAVVASNAVGIVVDSIIFLALATPLGPDRLDYLPGQVVGKATMTLVAIVVLAGVRRERATA